MEYKSDVVRIVYVRSIFIQFSHMYARLTAAFALKSSILYYVRQIYTWHDEETMSLFLHANFKHFVRKRAISYTRQTCLRIRQLRIRRLRIRELRIRRLHIRRMRILYFQVQRSKFPLF